MKKHFNEEEVYENVLEITSKEHMTCKELSDALGVSFGSMNRWLIKWKDEKRIGHGIEEKKKGMGLAQVFFPPRN